jgi:hypothetical protein
VTEQCVHEEFLEYLGRRHLGYCHKCGRTMEYDPTGAEKPRDVTAEFGGKSPFPAEKKTAVAVSVGAGASVDAGVPYRHLNGYTNYNILPGDSQRAREHSVAQRMSTEALEASAEGVPHQRNNFARMAWYLEHKDAIIADVVAMGPTQARKKWHIPSSTFSHHLQVWGVAVPHRKSPEKKAAAGERAPAIVGMPRWTSRGPKDNTAKGRYWKGHVAEIEADLRTIGPDETRRKWGMGEKWLYHWLPALASRQLWKASLSGQLAAVAPVAAEASAPAGQVDRSPSSTEVTSQPAPDGWHDLVVDPLPAWNEGWDPTVQVQWLRSTTAIVVAETLREDRRAVAAA